jgi:hypothetical protein
MLLLLTGCDVSAPRERVEPSFIHVDLLDASTAGSPDAPLAFSASERSFGIVVTTYDVTGKSYPFNGELSLDVRPGRLTDPTRVAVVDGTWSGTVGVEAAFGPARVWARDEDVTDDRPPSWSAGVSPALHFQFPTIPEMQATDNHETNQLEGEFAELRLSDRQVVVTATDAAGFWVSDLGAAPGNYAGLYIYTFSKPADEIVVGAHLTSLNGQDSEYLASTQLNFPTLLVAEGETLTPPAAVLLDSATACDNDAMEKLEGSRVRAEGPVIPATFTTDSEAFEDYASYGQWPLNVGSCELYVESGATVPDYYPPDHAGETLSHVEGMVKEVYGKWIFLVLDPLDIGDAVSARKGTP